MDGKKIILGEGQFGIVYKGMCRASPVAIKVLKSDQITKGKKHEFLREVEIMSSPQMRHPNLVLLQGACVAKVGKWAMITEFCSRGSLEDILFKSAEKINFSLKIQFAIDICNGMAWMSGQEIRIIHRDLKPANILVDENWRCKIGDFGLSLLLARGVVTAGKRGIQGSALYMAPEALLEKEHEITEKTDVYAFGLLFWEILTRQKVFLEYDKRGDLNYFTDAIVQYGVRPDLTNIHPLLQQLLTVCWADSPAQRPTFQQLLKKEWWDKEETLPSLPLTRVLIYLPRKICPHAALFWLNTYGFEIRVPLEKFVDSMCSTFGITNQKFFVHCISQLFQITDKDMRLSYFSKLLKWFGPMYGHENLLNRLVYIMKQRWFYGTKTALEAEAYLDNERQSFGPFLVRLNSGQKVPIDVSPFTISHFSSEGQFLHTRVYPENGGYYIKLQNGTKIHALGLVDNMITELARRNICVSPCRPLNPFAFIINSENIDGTYISKYQNDDEANDEDNSMTIDVRK